MIFRLLLVPTLFSCSALHSTASQQQYEYNSFLVAYHFERYIKVANFYPMRPQKVSMSHVTETEVDYPRITLCSPAFFTKERYFTSRNGKGHKRNLYVNISRTMYCIDDVENCILY